jgi:hypothetical protein
MAGDVTAAPNIEIFAYQSILIFFGAQQRDGFFDDFIQNVLIDCADKFRLTLSPIKTLQLIGENHSRHHWIVGDQYFPRIALLLVRNRTDHGETEGSVIVDRRQNERGAATRLFVARLRIKVQPNDISPTRHIATFAHRDSFPTGGPVEISAWMFSAVTPAISCLNE